MNRWTTKQEQDEVVQLYQSGLPMKQVGERCDLSAAGVLKILRKHGVKSRSLSVAGTRHSIDESFFAKIDNPVKASILGFIWADGCITKSTRDTTYHLGIRLSSVDTDHLEWIRSQTGSSVPVRSAGINAVQWLVQNQKIVQDLRHLGVGPRKSLIIGFPDKEVVPEEHLNSFILGVFEGDGSISRRKKRRNKYTDAYVVSICGTLAFCQGLKEVLNAKLGISTNIVQKTLPSGASFCDLRVEGNLQIVRFMEWIYRDCPHKMPRKHERYEALRALYGANMKLIRTPEVTRAIFECRSKSRKEWHATKKITKPPEIPCNPKEQTIA